MTSLPSTGGARGPRRQGSPLRYRLDIALRALAASCGAYALAAGVAGSLAPLLPVARVDAVLASTMLAFVVYAVAAMWSFRCASLVRLWTGLLLPAAILWAVARVII